MARLHGDSARCSTFGAYYPDMPDSVVTEGIKRLAAAF
jgi:hypothetical protein